MRFRRGCVSDADALARLINDAFVVERPIFDEDRTSADVVRSELEKGTFLLAEDGGDLIACVYVEPCSSRRDELRGYIGLLSVDPARQGTGLGRKALQVAEEFCREAGCIAVDLRVISARTSLPAFYHHLGYTETHTSELPANAKPKIPCHYIHMSKRLVGEVK